MDNTKSKACSKTTYVTSLVVGVVLIGSLFLTLSSATNQVATVQQLLLPNNPFLQHLILRQQQLLQSSSLLGNINNINNRL